VCHGPEGQLMQQIWRWSGHWTNVHCLV